MSDDKWQMDWEIERQREADLEELFGPSYTDYTHDELGQIAECRKCGAMVRRGWRETGADVHLKWHQSLEAPAERQLDTSNYHDFIEKHGYGA